MSIHFDHGNREYEADSAVGGYLRVSPRSSVRYESISICCICRVRYDDSTTEDHAYSTRSEEAGHLTAGKPVDFAFELKTPLSPLTYSGKLFSVEHLVQATLYTKGEPDVVEEGFSVIPSSRQISYGTGSGESATVELAALEGMRSDLAKRIVIALIILFALGSCSGGVLFLLAFALCSKKVREKFSPKEPGTLQVLLGSPWARAGGHLPVRGVFNSACERDDVSVFVTLTGREIVSRDSPGGVVVDERELFHKRYVMIRDERIPRGKRATFDTRIPMPDTTAYSMDVDGAVVEWSTRIECHIPGHEDWEELLHFNLVPAVLEQAGRKPPPIPKRTVPVMELPLQETMSHLHEPEDERTTLTPIPPPPSTFVIEDDGHEASEEDVAVADESEEKKALVELLRKKMLEEAAGDVERPVLDPKPGGFTSHITPVDSPAERATTERLWSGDRSERLFVSSPPEERVVASVTPEDVEWPASAGISMEEIIADILAAGRYSSEQKNAIEKHKGYQCNVSLVIKRVERSFGLNAGDEYRNGMSAIGKLESSDTELSVCFPAVRTDEVRDFSVGSVQSLRVRFSDYNSIRRQAMCEVV